MPWELFHMHHNQKTPHTSIAQFNFYDFSWRNKRFAHSSVKGKNKGAKKSLYNFGVRSTALLLMIVSWGSMSLLMLRTELIPKGEGFKSKWGSVTNKWNIRWQRAWKWKTSIFFVCVFFFVNLRLLKDDEGECANGSAPNKRGAGEGVALRGRGRGIRFLCCCTIIVELLLFITTYTLFDFSYKEFQFLFPF